MFRFTYSGKIICANPRNLWINNNPRMPRKQHGDFVKWTPWRRDCRFRRIGWRVSSRRIRIHAGLISQNLRQVIPEFSFRKMLQVVQVFMPTGGLFVHTQMFA